MGPKSDYTILLGEDDLEVRRYLETALRCQGYTVQSAQDGEEVLACFHALRSTISAVVLDMIMPRKDGLDALREIRRCSPDVPVIMISGAASSPNIVRAMKNGATNFIPKPVQPGDLRDALQLALEPNPTVAKGADAETAKSEPFFGNSPYMRELKRLIRQIAVSDVPILIQGETGAGKEVVSREIHAQSRRCKKPLWKLNCAALPSELVESELFGYERGAFTGAFQRKPGMFELADGGALLLDEIGDMDIRLQAKLLQVLQDQSFHRLGGKEAVKVDVRVIAASHRDLRKAISDNLFREDLFYRLNVISIQVPPLRDRKEDILPLADVLLRKYSPAGAPPIVLPPSTQTIFLNYQWPGNVRELENVIRKFVVLRNERMIESDLCSAADRPLVFASPARSSEPEIESTSGPQSGAVGMTKDPREELVDLERVASATRDAERAAITAALKRTNWNRRQAAVLLKIDYKGLLYKMKKLSIKKEKAAPYLIRRAGEASSAAGSSGAAAPSAEVLSRHGALL